AITATQVSNGFEVSAADLALNKLTFAPAANRSEERRVGNEFQARGDGGTLKNRVDTDQSANTLTIDVNTVKHAPAGANATVVTNEDTAYTFHAADFGFTDADGNAFDAVKISAPPLDGTRKYVRIAITATQVSNGFEVSAADLALNKLTFAPAAN